jgi:hypothetical protein
VTFIHGYLLGGLLLAGVPVLIHLVMRQKPRRLSFPAFRFLRQQHRFNQRRIRLQHLLLLLLRMALIAALCLALARPRVRTSALSIGAEQPVAAVLVFDTSASMGLTDGKQTRLDEARARARELLDEMADGSRLALLDTGDDTASGEGVDELAANLGLVRTRLDGLRVRPNAGALNRTVARAARLLQQAATGEEPLPRFLYVFSDRTRASWDGGPVSERGNESGAEQSNEPLPLEGTNVVYVDVGKDGPRDLAIDDVKIEPPVVAPGAPLTIRVTVRASGGDFENDLTCQIDDDPQVGRVDPKQVKCVAGRSEEVVFERKAPPHPEGQEGDATFQVTVKLVNDDALPFNDVRHATFVVRDRPRILTLADDPHKARVWATAIRALALRPGGGFDVTVKRPSELNDKDLASARVVCLFEVAHPEPQLWAKLDAFVRRGGGLAVVPGGAEMEAGAYAVDAATKLLPGKYRDLILVPTDKPHVAWAPFEGQDDLTRPFREWERAGNTDLTSPERRPFVNGYWRVEPADFAVASYADGKKSPALLVRTIGAGRIVQLTGPLDDRKFPAERPWQNYYEVDAWFGLVLVDRVCTFLAGAATAPTLNFLSGNPVQLTLTGPPATPPLKLTGPEPSATEARLTTDEGQLSVTGADEPGNYQVQDGRNGPVAAFSVAVRREESDLQRVPVEELEAALGKGTVLPAEHRTSLRDLLQGRWSAPVELMPWLMILLLMAMTFEGFLANKFYRRPAEVKDNL